MSRHLTYRFWLCVTTASCGLVGGVALGEPAVLAFGLPFLLALLLSMAEEWWPSVTVNSAEPSTVRAVEGDIVKLVVELDVPARTPYVDLELQVSAAMESTDSLHRVTSFTTAGRHTETFSLRLVRWGVARPDWLTVVTRDRFGMTEVVQHVLLPTPIRVHPHTERLIRMAPLARTNPAVGDHRSRRRGSGTELAEVRPFRPDDPLRSVHPRLSARRGMPMVTERHVEESSDVVIYVDSVQDIGEDIETTLRWTVTASTALAKRHLRSMDRVGILDRGAGVRWLEPSLGRRSLHTIVDALLATTVLPTAGRLPAISFGAIPAGATIFAVSPLLSVVVRNDLATLRRRGHEVVVIRPDALPPADVSYKAQRIFRVQNEIKRRELADVGIFVVPWDPAEPLEPAIRRVAAGMGRMRAGR